MLKNWRLTRRRTLGLGLGLATLAGMGTVAKAKDIYLAYQIQQLDNPKRNFPVVGNASLKERAAAKGLIYGAAGNYQSLSSDAEFASKFVQECGILVPENELKFSNLRPSPDRFDFTYSDWLAKFCQTNRLLFRGHTLVWHYAIPQWFKDTVNRKNAERILIEHIQTVAGRYAGKIHSWDVVNEAVFPPDGRSDGLRNSVWLDLLGADYIEIAFRAAAQADPNALLVYNDNEMWLDTSGDEAKKIAVLKLLERLKSKGVPVQALGIQSHLYGAALDQLNPKRLRAFMRDIANLGLKILITEMDVIDQQLPSNIEVRDRIVASAYEDYLSIVLDQPATIAVLTWGLSDRYTWLSSYAPREDNQPVRPLPLDSQFKRKLAWNAIARALDNAPRR